MEEKWSTDGVVVDSYDRNAATASVKHMVRIMDQAAKPNQASEVGFDEAGSSMKHRRSSFDLAHDRMFDFLYAYHTALASSAASAPDVQFVKALGHQPLSVRESLRHGLPWSPELTVFLDPGAVLLD